MANAIELENANVGTTGWALTNPATTHQVEGYAGATSVNHGSNITFHISVASAENVQIDIYRMGWYAGDGGRLLQTIASVACTNHTTPSPDSFGLIDCAWPTSHTLTTDATWCSGIFLAKLTGLTSTKQSYIIFTVRDDSRTTSEVLYQSPTATWQAYNPFGGRNLYTVPQAVKVSYNRPYAVPTEINSIAGVGAGEFLATWSQFSYGLSSDYALVRFQEREGYDVSYCTNEDLDTTPSLLLGHKGIVSVWHDEYWTSTMRDAWEAARDHSPGVNLAFFGGNTGFWQTRYEDGRRTIVCYKETALTDDPDQSSTGVTTSFRNAAVGRPEAALVGGQYIVSTVANLTVANAAHALFIGTGWTNATVLNDLLGHEVDETTGASPVGITVLMHSPCPPTDFFGDMTVYTAASEAKVFNAATFRLPWLFDGWEFSASQRGDYSTAAGQQFGRNIFNMLINVETNFNVVVTGKAVFSGKVVF